jgi:hypothetical protein
MSKNGTITHEGPAGGTKAKTPKALGDGRHSAGGGGTNRGHLDSARFPGSGINRSIKGDGRSAGMDGVVDKGFTVKRTREMGRQNVRRG